MARHDLSDLSDHDLARLLGAKGRHGDTMVAHISPQEAGLLKRLGGAGTRNPKTGLLEFFGAEGGMGAGGKSTADKGSGNGAGGKGGRSDSQGGTVAAGAKQGGIGAGYGGNAGAKAGGAPAKGMDSSGQVSGGPLNEQIAQTMAAFKRAQNDFADTDNSTLGDIGNALAGLAGFGEIDPATQGMGAFDPRQNGTIAAGGPAAAKADWGADYGAMLAGLAGLATGMPLGLGYTALTKLGKYAGVVDPSFGIANLGPDPFSGTPSAGGTYGGGQTSTASGAGGMAGGAGNPRGDTVAQAAQKANAGGGLLAALNPQAAPMPSPTVPALPGGLLAYLARNPGLLPGYSGTSRFGSGTVAPISYGRPLA